MQKRYAIYVGIDPGVKTGWACWDGTDLVLKTLTFWEVFEEALRFETDEVLFCAEDPSLINATFTHARGHGSVKREAQLLIEGLEDYGYDVRRCRPAGKVNHDFFTRLTGYPHRTNQHTRDAAMLVYDLPVRKPTPTP